MFRGLQPWDGYGCIYNVHANSVVCDLHRMTVTALRLLDTTQHELRKLSCSSPKNKMLRGFSFLFPRNSTDHKLDVMLSK